MPYEGVEKEVKSVGVHRRGASVVGVHRRWAGVVGVDGGGVPGVGVDGGGVEVAEDVVEADRELQDMKIAGRRLTSVVIQPFQQPTGPAVSISAVILEVFQMFFTTSLIDLIVEQSNLYASQVMGPEAYVAWEKIVAEEIWAFFGFMILMGINQLSSLLD